MSARRSLRPVCAALVAAMLVACGGMPGEERATTFERIGESVELTDSPTPTPSEGPQVDCGEIRPADCEQAVMAIVHGLPYGYAVVEIELGPLGEDIAITPEPAWTASARALMKDGFEYDLVIVQDVRPGPMEINFAPDD